MNHIIKNLLASITAFAVIAFACNAHAVDTTDPLAGVKRTVEHGIDGYIYKPRTIQSVPDGINTNYTRRWDNESIYIEHNMTAGYNVDFGDHVNTTARNVKVMDITADFNAGIGLGCNGLNLAAESLFKFDASNFLNDLKNYATTKLATEALAQIYATPLISTVMDGIKSMNNFVAEFSQATCDMSEITGENGRAAEIRKERIMDCVEKETGGAPAGTTVHDAAMQKCSDPGEVVKSLKEFQCSMKNLAPSSESLYSLFGESYGSGGETKGEMISMFIPDIKFKLNGGNSKSTETSPAKVSTFDMQSKGYNYSRSLIYNIFYDIRKAANKRGAITKDQEIEIFRTLDAYKEILLDSGDRRVFEDASSDTTEVYSADSLAAIKSRFKSTSKIQFNDSTVASGTMDFLIGPEEGPNGSTLSSTYTSGTGAQTSFDPDGETINVVLEAGRNCWAKVNMGSSKYKWTAIHKNPDAIYFLDNLDASMPTVDATIKRLSECVTLKVISFADLHSDAVKSEIILMKSMKKMAALSALQATKLYVANIENDLNMAIANSKAILLSRCNSAPGTYGAMPQTAANPTASGCGSDSSNVTGKSYTSCEEYAEQNQLTDEKKAHFQAYKESAKRALSIMQADYDLYRDTYNDAINRYALEKSYK